MENFEILKNPDNMESYDKLLEETINIVESALQKYGLGHILNELNKRQIKERYFVSKPNKGYAGVYMPHAHALFLFLKDFDKNTEADTKAPVVPEKFKKEYIHVLAHEMLHFLGFRKMTPSLEEGFLQVQPEKIGLAAGDSWWGLNEAIVEELACKALKDAGISDVSCKYESPRKILQIIIKKIKSAYNFGSEEEVFGLFVREHFLGENFSELEEMIKKSMGPIDYWAARMCVGFSDWGGCGIALNIIKSKQKTPALIRSLSAITPYHYITVECYMDLFFNKIKSEKKYLDSFDLDILGKFTKSQLKKMHDRLDEILFIVNTIITRLDSAIIEKEDLLEEHKHISEFGGPDKLISYMQSIKERIEIIFQEISKYYTPKKTSDGWDCV